MFGYVRPSLGHLTEADKHRFAAMYCGLCHTLGRRYGKAAQMILNYDFTFLALLLSPPVQPEQDHRRCLAHPVHGRDYFLGNDALELAADCSVILAWWQIQDAIADGGALERVKYRAAAASLAGAYRKARALRPGFDQSTQRQLALLGQLEREKCLSMDHAADAFAQLLSGIAGEVDEPTKARVLSQLFYHLGRWIYLVDASDDLSEDFSQGRYNPLIYRFSLTSGELTSEAREALVLTLDQSIRHMAAAFELWEFGVWSPIIRSVVYEGLFLVGKAVLEGTFQAEARPLRVHGREEEQL